MLDRAGRRGCEQGRACVPVWACVAASRGVPVCLCGRAWLRAGACLRACVGVRGCEQGRACVPVWACVAASRGVPACLCGRAWLRAGACLCACVGVRGCEQGRACVPVWACVAASRGVPVCLCGRAWLRAGACLCAGSKVRMWADFDDGRGRERGRGAGVVAGARPGLRAPPLAGSPVCVCVRERVSECVSVWMHALETRGPPARAQARGGTGAVQTRGCKRVVTRLGGAASRDLCVWSRG
jgi:hypothetical protein